MHIWISEAVGQGSVTGHRGDALYDILFDYGTAYVSSVITRIDRDVEALDTSIADLQSKRSAIQATLSPLLANVDALIANVADAANDQQREIAVTAVNDATKIALEAGFALPKIDDDIADATIAAANLRARKNDLIALSLSNARTAWCADYTTLASGPVATIEIDGEQPKILIAPGGAQPTAGYGRLQHRMAMTGAATYLNAALLPGWQKYKPTYRSGVLTAIDRGNNLGNISLDAATSSAQSLPINQSDTLLNVEFQYMTCNNLAFTVGDSVVVQFENQDWAQPKIIGFVSNPKPCSPERIIVPLRFVSYSIDVIRSVPGGRDIMRQTGVQWSVCSAGSILTIKQSPLPPGFANAGQQNRALTTNWRLTPVYTSGIISSDIEYGGLGSFVFRDDYRISGAAPDIDYVPPASAISSVAEDLGQGLFGFTDTTIFVPTPAGNTLEDYRAEVRQLNSNVLDLEELQAFIACTKLGFDSRFSGAPASISIQQDSGPAIIYDLSRWGRLTSFPDHPDFPSSTFDGLALGYRRRRS